MTYLSRYDYGFTADVPDDIELGLSVEQAEDLYLLISNLSCKTGKVDPEEEFTRRDFDEFVRSLNDGPLSALSDLLNRVSVYGQVEDPEVQA